MVYCSKCGTQIPDDAYFCVRCGIKTEAGKTAQAVYPTDALRTALYQTGIELEKAFTFAAQEIHTAFDRVNEGMHQKSSQDSSQKTDTLICTSCGTKNPSDATFCGSCGKKLLNNCSS